MNEMDLRLEELEKAGMPVRVSLIGAGQMGKDIVVQIGKMAGIVCDVVVDLDIREAMEAYRCAGIAGDVIATDDFAEAARAVQSGKKVITTNHQIAVGLDGIQSVIDATGSPEMGARVTMECIHHKRHIVMMNVECDVTIGPILRRMCQQAGVIYSLTAGDEPGAIIEIFRFAKTLGFEIVAAGKGKNNPLDFSAHPGMPEWAEKAAARNMNARMLIEFVDGSKTMIEMAAVSNATGLRPDIRGMHGPRCNIADLARVFSLKSQGGILNRSGVVDYGIGDIHPGVFVVVTTDNERIKSGLTQRDMGDGPNYLLLRPYHLCSIETPLTAIQQVVYGTATAYPREKLTSECITIAKKDLAKGETLDAIGEYCYRASIDLYETAKAGNMLPVGIAKGAVLTRDVAKDTIITYDMVSLDDRSVLLQLRRLQDQLMG